MDSGVTRFGKQISAGTQQIASQAAVVARIAGKRLSAGLRTCEENSNKNFNQFEVVIGKKLPYQAFSKCADALDTNEANFSISNHSIGLYDGDVSKNPNFISNFLEAVSSPYHNEKSYSKDTTYVKSSSLPGGLRIWGAKTFELHVDLLSHGLLSRRLVVSAERSLASKNSKDPPETRSIPIHCIWKRRLVGQLLEIPDVHDVEYPITADDAMSHILIEARPLDGSPDEVVYAECGPFDIDASFRKYLNDYLAAGQARFSVRLLEIMSSKQMSRTFGESSLNSSDVPWLSQVENEHESFSIQNQHQYDEELIFHVTEDGIKVVKPGHQHVGSTKTWSCKFGSIFPQIILSKENLLKFHLHINEEDILVLTAPTHSQRDILALTVRCFHARRWTANSMLLQSATYSAGTNTVKSEFFYPSSDCFKVDLLSMVERLTAELYECLERHGRCLREKDRVQTEKNFLEEDISSTLEAYQQLLTHGSRINNERIASKHFSTGDHNGKFPDHSNEMLLEPNHSVSLATYENKLHVAQEKIDELNRELQVSRQEIIRLQNYVAEKDKNDSSKKKNVLTQHVVHMDYAQFIYYKETQEKFFADLQNVKRETETETQKLDMLKKKNNELQFACDTLTNKIMKAKQIQSNFSMSPSGHSELKEMNGSVCDGSDVLKKQIFELKSKNKELEETCKNYKQSLVKLQNESDKKLTSLNETLEVLKKEAKVNEEILEKSRRQFDEVVTERNRYMKRNEVLSRDMEKVQSSFESKTTALAELKKKYLDEKQLLEEQHRRSLSDIKEQYVTSINEATALKNIIKEKDNIIEQNGIELEKFKKKTQVLQSRLQKLSETFPSQHTID